MENIKKIRFYEKFSFTLGGVGAIAAQTFITSFLLIFYTDICGLNPADVATLFLVAKILDAVNNPFTGYIIDHLPKTKMGRFRLTFVIGSILFALNVALLFLGPLWATGSKLFVAYLSYILLGITLDFTEIPRNSLLVVMTDDMKERGNLCTLKAFSTLLGGAAIAIITPILLKKAPSPTQGYIWMVVGVVLCILIFNTNAGFHIKERIEAGNNNELYKVKDLLKIFTVPPVLVVFFVSLLNNIFTTMNSTTTTYYAKYILGDISILSINAIISLFGTIPSMLMGGVFSSKFGKKNVFCVSISICGVATLLKYLNPSSVTLLYISTFITSLGIGSLLTTSAVFQADIVDIAEYHTGVRAVGAVSALNSFTMKLGATISAALPGYILAATGYNSNLAATTQNYVPMQSTMNGILFMSLILPAFFCFATAILMWFGFHIDNKKFQKMLCELKKRRIIKKSDELIELTDIEAI